MVLCCWCCIHLSDWYRHWSTVSGIWWYFCLQSILRSRVLAVHIIASITLGIKSESRDTLTFVVRKVNCTYVLSAVLAQQNKCDVPRMSLFPHCVLVHWCPLATGRRRGSSAARCLRILTPPPPSPAPRHVKVSITITCQYPFVSVFLFENNRKWLELLPRASS